MANSDKKVQKHPYQPYVPEGATTLILGSAPPRRFCLPRMGELNDYDVDWYYGSYTNGRYNYFWDTLFEVFDYQPNPDLNFIRALRTSRNDRTAVQRKFFKEFLQKNKIGIADILSQFVRIKESDLDQDISVKTYRSITEILNKQTDIELICCTSEYVYRNILEALPKNKKIVFNTWMTQYDYILEGIDAIPVPDRIERKIKVKPLLSPSPINRRNYVNEDEFKGALVKNYIERMKQDE